MARVVSSRRVTVVSLNVENVVPLLTAGKLPEMARALDEPEVLCLQELRIRESDHDLGSALARSLGDYECGLSLNRDLRNVTFRGGRMYGVATFVKRALAPRFANLAWDKEGRVVIAVFPDLRLVVANVYAVNGTDKPYFDHDLGTVNGDRHLFKRRFIEALGSDMRALRDQGYELILTGDWNVSRTKLDTHPRLRTEEPHAVARKAFNEEFIPSLDLVDIFRELHPEERAYTWFNRRSRTLDAARVDFTLVSRGLVERVESAGIRAEKALRFGSDHAPHWVTL